MSSNKRSSPSLSIRLTSRFTTLLIVSHLIFLLAIAFVLKQGLADKDRNLVHARQREFASILAREGLERLKEGIERESERTTNYHLLVRVLSTDGQVIYEKLPERLKNFDMELVKRKLSAAFEHPGYHMIPPRRYGEETIELLSEPVNHKYVLMSGLCTEESEDFMGTFIKSALLAAFGSILLSMLLGYFYTRNSLRPIHSLISIIKKIQGGQRRALVSEDHTHAELSDLIGLFNKMTGEINHLIDSLQFSLDSIAHDLRTPLTHLVLRFEKALAGDGDTVSKDFIHECIEEVQAISHVLTSLLEISEADAGSFKIQKSSFDVRRLLEECAEVYEYVAEDREATIKVGPETFFIQADRNLLRRVISNLIDNALKYSEKNVLVDITATETAENWIIRVKDNGWGISPEDQGKIWQRLYRGDKSRSTEGIGVGLSFVKPVVEFHGGRIEVESESGKGSTFILTFPRSTNLITNDVVG